MSNPNAQLIETPANIPGGAQYQQLDIVPALKQAIVEGMKRGVLAGRRCRAPYHPA